MKISAVNTEGMLVGPTPETYSDGVLRFSLGGPFASIYYLIQKHEHAGAQFWKQEGK